MFKEIRSSLALRLLALVLGMLGSVLVARLGGPEVKGVSSAFAAANAIGFMVINFDSGQFALRYARQIKDKTIAWKILFRVWFLYCSLIPLALLLLIFIDVSLLWYLVGAVGFGVAAQAGVVSVGYRGPMVGSLGAVAQQFTLIVAAMGFAIFSDLDVTSIKIAILMSYVAPLPMYLVLRPKGNTLKRTSELPNRTLARLLLRSVPWQIGRVAQTLMQKMDVLLVFALLGAAQSGFYSVGVSTAMLVTIIPAQYASLTLHDISSGDEEPSKDRSLQAIGSGILSAAPLVLGGYWFIEIAYGAEFVDAYLVMLTCLPGAIAYGALQVQSNYIRLIGTWREFFIANGAGVLMMAIGLCFMVLVFDMQLLGAGIAFSLGSITAAIVARLLIRRLPYGPV